MTMLAIIADDLSGALDAAAPFATRGLRTVVALAPAGIAAALRDAPQVIGVSTGSREADPAVARAAVQQALAALPPGTRIFKKVDSRLKGNIGTELDAIPYRRALVVPAIPAFGRWVRDGRLGGFGVSNPVAVAGCLGAHADRASIPDIDRQADIDAALAATRCDLLVGARGLAEALALRLAPSAPATAVALPPAAAVCVIGSTDPITLEQVERLRAAVPELLYIAAPGGMVPTPLPPVGALTLIQAIAAPAPVAAALVEQRLGEALGRLVAPPGTRLVLSSGATAQAVLLAMRTATLEVLGEALPGLPVARAGGFTIITKSGGFGDPDTLLRLLGHASPDGTGGRAGGAAEGAGTSIATPRPAC